MFNKRFAVVIGATRRAPRWLALLLSLTALVMVSSLGSLATPVVTIVNLPAYALIGEEFTFDVVFKNDPGPVGFAPFIDLVAQAGGVGLHSGAVNHCDGIIIESAKIVSVGQSAPAAPVPLIDACDGVTILGWTDGNLQPGPWPLTLDPTPDPCVGSCPNGPCTVSCLGFLTHHYTPTISPVAITPGDMLWSMMLPFSQFDSTQSPVVIRVTAKVSEFADIDAPLYVSARGGFLYGETTLGSSPVLSLWVTDEVDTKVLTLKKEYLGPECETVACPNCPMTYEIAVQVAEGQTIDGLSVRDYLPTTLYYDGQLQVSLDGGVTWLAPPPACSNSPCPLACADEPTGGPGGDLTVSICIPVIGVPNLPEVLIRFACYVPDGVLRPDCSNSPVLLRNDAMASGMFDPLDPRDSTASVTSDALTSAIDQVWAKCIAIQKSVALAVDTGSAGLTPGDVLMYQLDFQISDCDTIGEIKIRDHLSDGQKLASWYQPPTVTVWDQFVPAGYTAGFDSTTLGETPNPGFTCPLPPAGPPVTGTTDLTFAVSGAMHAAAVPTTPATIAAGILTGGHATLPPSPVAPRGRLTFYVEVTDEFFVNSATGLPPHDTYVDKDDPITDCVEIFGTVLWNDDLSVVLGHASDDSSTFTRIVDGTLEKSVYAVNGNTTVLPIPEVLPGDIVTFRIQYTIPSGDAENLSIRDWLPLPVFNVYDCNGDTVQNDPLVGGAFMYPYNSPPGVGVADFGPLHSQPVNTLTTYFWSPTVALLAGNCVEFDYMTVFDQNNVKKLIDVLFTLTVTHDPYPDDVILGNEALLSEDDTFGEQFTQTALGLVDVREPELSVKKGVIATNNTNPQFGTYDPASCAFAPGVAPVPAGKTPHSMTPHVVLTPTSPVKHSNLSNFIERDVRNVDAGDWVTFAIAVENTGGAPAYEIELRDIIPLNGGTPCCFTPAYGGVKYGMSVTDGSGTALWFTQQTCGPDCLRIELTGPLPPLDANSAVSGTNIAIITFDAQLLDASSLQSGCCSNKVELVRYTSAPDATAPAPAYAWPNFVTAGFGGPFEDTATICVGPSAYAKCVQATSEAHTTPLNGTWVDATIGEIVRFRLITVIPEGTTQHLRIEDLLPVGLTYVGNPVLVFVANTPVTSPQGAFCTIPGDEGTYGLCPGVNLPLALCSVSPVPTVAVSPFVFGQGQDPFFFEQTQYASTPYYDITNHDQDTNLELAIIEFNAQVDNIASNHGDPPQTDLVNQFEVTYDGACGGCAPSSLSSLAHVQVVEPQLTVTKTVSPTTTQPNGTVTYTVKIAHDMSTSTADAFDIYFEDTLPTDLTPTGVSCTGCSGALSTCTFSGQVITVTCPRLNQIDTMTITYQAIVSPTAPCTPITNTATVTWTSLPVNGTPPGLLNLTGQSTVGASGDPDGERDGSNGLLGSGVLNDYRVQAWATVTVECCPCVPLPPKMAAWWPLDETSGQTVHDLVGGFDGTAMHFVGGTASPADISTPGAPKSSIDWPFPSFLPKGRVDNALFFYAGGFIKVPQSPALDPSTGPFSVDAWVVYSHASSPSVGGFVIASKGTSTGWTLYIDPAADRVLCQLTASGGSQWTMQAPITPNVWHHVALTIARGTTTATINLYVDGVPTSWSGSMASGFNFSSNAPLYIGGDGAGTPYEIAIDEVEIFHCALAQSEVEGIFNADSAGKCKPDLGDAPDSTNHAGSATCNMWAYATPNNVLAHFPTVYAPSLPGNAPLGPIHWDPRGFAWLGAEVTAEQEADTGWDQDPTHNIDPNPSACYADRDVADDGVTLANVALALCGMTTFPLSATNGGTQVQAYINVWFDWNRDGDWNDVVPCAGTSLVAAEWAVQNHTVTLNPGFNDLNNNLAMVTPPFMSITPPPGQGVWMRITLTDVPVDASNSDGSGPVGGYCFGETEDYLVVAPQKADPGKADLDVHVMRGACTCSGRSDCAVTLSVLVENHGAVESAPCQLSARLDWQDGMQSRQTTTTSVSVPAVAVNERRAVTLTATISCPPDSKACLCSTDEKSRSASVTIDSAGSPPSYQVPESDESNNYDNFAFCCQQDGSVEPPVSEDCIEADVQTRTTEYGAVRIEACVTRSPDRKMDTYTYTVTNESFLVLECGICWFSIPNPSNLATISQTGPEGWTTTPTWGSGWAEQVWRWVAPARSCGLMPGAPPMVFAVSVPAPSSNVPVYADIGWCNMASITAVGAPTIGPVAPR